MTEPEPTYSLSYVADHWLPDEWTDGARWLARRLRSGELAGVRFGRTWMMRASDVTYMLDKYAAGTGPAESAEPERPHTLTDGLSARSRKRLRRAQ